MDSYEYYDDPELYEKQTEYEQPPVKRTKKREVSIARVLSGMMCMMASFALLLAMYGKLQIPWPQSGLPAISILSSGESGGGMYEATGSAVNIRSGPGMEYDAFSRALQGETLESTGNVSSDGAWIEVICPENGEHGWSSADYLKKVS